MDSLLLTQDSLQEIEAAKQSLGEDKDGGEEEALSRLGEIAVRAHNALNALTSSDTTLSRARFQERS